MKTFQENLNIFEGFIEEKSTSRSVMNLINAFKKNKQKYKEGLEEIRHVLGKSGKGWVTKDKSVAVNLRNDVKAWKDNMNRAKSRLKELGITKIPS